ncbi:MCE family protein [Jatrophihabitans sp. YIM 134969]
MSLKDRLLPSGTRIARIIGLLLVVVVVAGGLIYLLAGSPTKKVSAQFSSAVGMYPGSDVRMLGVKIGKVTKVTPKGTGVDIAMEVEKDRALPANAIATIVPPSLVSDRYVQLAPVYTGGPQLADGAVIPRNRTATPVELDDIYKALNQVTTALGPAGANKNGALSELLATSAKNLDGNGTALGQTITNLSQAVTTLATSRDDLFGTVANLQTFTKALQDSDAQVVKVNQLLDTVAGDLADERASLASAITNLRQALTQVAAFLQKNQDVFAKDVRGLAQVTGVLSKKQAALREILAVAPVALSNLAHTYNPSSGTLDVRANIASLFDPGQICQALLDGTALSGIQLVGGIYKIIAGATRLDAICAAVLNALPATPTIPGLPVGLPPLPSIPGLPPLLSSTESGSTTGGGTLPRIGLPTVPGLG